MTPATTETKGRFALKLKQPGSLTVGYAFLQPGPWGRFKDLPVRRDVAEALVDQGLTLLRYGGSMVNHPEYRWKKMIGPRDRRPPHRGTWYPHSSNGWGIPDFMEFCEAAGFEYVPAFNMDETPQDLADFIEYAKGDPASPWGRRRVADGHPQPYRLRCLQLGNEERVDDRYAARFEALAAALWARDTNVVLVVGDFVYGQPIRDPFNFRGAASGITSLAGQQRILRFARQHDREVWFDVHVGTDGPRPDATFDAMFTFRDALAKVADGARHQVVVFEFNAGNHTHRRALANALALQALERDGRIPIAASANCLQPDGQNDNGWDQGLLFLNSSRVWLQPPGWVTRMVARHYQPLHVPARVEWLERAAREPLPTPSPPGPGAARAEGGEGLDVSAKSSDDGRTLCLTVVNSRAQPVSALLVFEGFRPARPGAEVEELAGPLEARNTADQPGLLTPKTSPWPHGLAEGQARRVFPAHSFSVLVFQ